MILSEQEYKIELLAAPVIYQEPFEVIASVGPSLMVQAYSTSTVPVSKAVQWDSVSGVDKVEVTSGSIKFGASNDEITLSGISLCKEGNHHILNFLQPVHLSSLSLQGFTYIPSGESEAISFTASSSSYLVVAIPNDQTTWLPIYSIPHISKESTPRQYAGASFSGNSVSFPRDMQPTKKVRLSVIKNFSKDNEEVLSSTISSVSARTKNLPIDLNLKNDTDNTILFEHKGIFLNDMPEVVFDLVNPAQTAFDKQLAQQKSFSFQYTLQAKNNTAFQYASTTVKGALLRTFKGVSSAVLKGEAAELSIDLSRAELDTEQPAKATADLTLTYEKLRILDRLNDDVPLTRGDVNGLIVSDEGVCRVLLDAEIANYPIDRIGIIGRAPEACELSLSLLPKQGETMGAPLTAPGVVQLDASTEIQVIWISLPQAITHEGALVVNLRANSGRFFWVTNPDPGIKVVVQDPKPNGGEILINDRILKKLDVERIHLPQVSIQADLFADKAPVLSSLLFVSIELSDLTLRYSR